MAKNINNKAFNCETQLKLDIFRECFREWFPVFLHNPYVSHIYIYDLFAGSGTDAEGKYGSPLILLEEARGEDAKHCSFIKNGNKQITFIFNEKEKTKKQEKFELLQSNVTSFFSKCKEENSCEQGCIYKYHCTNKGFKDGFYDDSTDFQNILNNSKFAKFLLLDQYGFSQIDNNVFNKLVNSPKTDFIFFIATSFITRFKEHDNVKKYIDTNKIEFDSTKPHECHRIIANYYQSLIPADKEYYLHHFTIENGANRYGLIFGTAHTLGMEKFLKVCWKYDNLAGEANMNIDGNHKPGELFYVAGNSNKKDAVKKEIKEMVLSGRIADNITGFKYALKQKCMPNVLSEVIKELESKNKLRRIGAKSYTSTDIHKIKVGSKDYYKIELL